jgi:NAD+--dinitrogen-reductase ADP-D-ribosyltransferase
MKGWAESRFGLLPRFHQVPIHSSDDSAYHAYQLAVAEGLYNTNSLEAQLDLLYTYCQYELGRQHPAQTHVTLYRGSNDIEKIKMAGGAAEGTTTLLLLNNLNSFSSDLERASEFGDRVFSTAVPLSKIIFYSALLPKYLKAENEFIVLGGVYECQRVM